MPTTAYKANRILADYLSVYIRLYTETPVDGASGTEVTGGSYAAQATTLTESTDQFSATTGADVSFTNMPSCDVTGWAVYDSTNTNMLGFDDFGAPVTFVAGDTATFPAGTFTVQVG